MYVWFASEQLWGMYLFLLLETDLVDALEEILDVIIVVHAVDHRSHIWNLIS